MRDFREDLTGPEALALMHKHLGRVFYQFIPARDPDDGDDDGKDGTLPY
jgi:hypothetical protein